MRPLLLVLLVPLSCGVRADTFEPECVASGRLHPCVPGPLFCTDVGTQQGWDVTFDPPADGPYGVEIVADGETTRFRCEELIAEDDGTYWAPDDSSVRACSPEGFSGGPIADEFVATVTVDGHEPVTTTEAPCWEVSEPNGRCCGYAYRASSTIPAFTD